MRGNLNSVKIRLLGLLLLFLTTASGVFAFSSAKSHQAKPAISVEIALKAIDFASKNDISIDSEFSANLRRGIEFTGRRYSELTNQYFNRNRYYSPALGRFISKDPIGFNGGNNLYRYADNNPVLLLDLFGLWTTDGNGLPVFSEAERWSSEQISEGLRSRGFQIDSVPTAIVGAIAYGGQFGQRLRDLIQMRLEKNQVFVFGGFDSGGSSFRIRDLPHTLKIEAAFENDPIMIAAALFHEFSEDWLGGEEHNQAEILEINLFKTLFRSSWQHWMPHRVYENYILNKYPNDKQKVKALFDCMDKPYTPEQPNFNGFFQQLRDGY